MKDLYILSFNHRYFTRVEYLWFNHFIATGRDRDRSALRHLIIHVIPSVASRQYSTSFRWNMYGQWILVLEDHVMITY